MKNNRNCELLIRSGLCTRTIYVRYSHERAATAHNDTIMAIITAAAAATAAAGNERERERAL